MRRPALLALIVLLALPLGGCAYFNGMYNTKRLAGRARKAEREGRTFEASSLWGQVSVKAESVLVRHPKSKWAEEARLLQGTAFLRLRDCERALPPLETVMTTGRNHELAEQAAMMVGECRLRIDDPLGASSAYGRLVDSENPGRRDVALWAHGRSLRLAGEYDAAVVELSASRDPRARGELAVALAASGQVEAAAVLADSLLQPADSMAPWEAIVGEIGRRDPARASELTSWAAANPGLPEALRARLLVADAIRLDRSDAAARDRRLFEAESLGAKSPMVVGEVYLTRARLLLREEGDTAILRQEAQRLGDFAEVGGPAAPAMLQVSGAIRRAVELADSVEPGAPLGDLRLFLAAELARDSAGLVAFPAGLFRRIPPEWPESPYGAKAIMALIDLVPPEADSLRALLAARFGTSPYVAVVQGGDGSEIAALEDSLRRYAVQLSRPARPQPARPGQRGRPQQPTRPADDL